MSSARSDPTHNKRQHQLKIIVRIVAVRFSARSGDRVGPPSDVGDPLGVEFANRNAKLVSLGLVRMHVPNRAVQAGKEVEVSVFGRNLGRDAKASNWVLSDKPLEECRTQVTAPADILKTGAIRYFEHPSQYSVAPTAATCTISSWQLRPNCDGRAALNAVSLVIADGNVTNEAEPNG